MLTIKPIKTPVGMLGPKTNVEGMMAKWPEINYWPEKKSGIVSGLDPVPCGLWVSSRFITWIVPSFL